MTQPEFLAMCRWKSARTQSYCARNSAEFVEEVTPVSFSTRNEALRIQVLTLLAGVDWPTASVILHFCSNEQYPVLDYRALWSLNTEQPNDYNFSFWQEYTEYFRKLAQRNNISMRTLDRALWQYSKEKQDSAQ